MPLFSEDVVEEKAFELAIRDPEYRKTRLAELRKQMRRLLWGCSGGCFIVGLYLFVNLRNPPNTTDRFFALYCVTSMVSIYWNVSRRYNEVKLLKMLDIQAEIAAVRGETKHG